MLFSRHPFCGLEKTEGKVFFSFRKVARHKKDSFVGLITPALNDVLYFYLLK